MLFRSISLIEWGLGAELPLAWRDDRRGLERVAMEMGAYFESKLSLSPGTTHAFYVYAEPALLFQLRATGQRAVVPTDRVDIEMARKFRKPVPTFLVFGLHAMEDPRFRDKLQTMSAHYEQVHAFAYQPSALVLLDHFDPRDRNAMRSTAEVRVYRVRE